jgi:hypothetical protein
MPLSRIKAGKEEKPSPIRNPDRMKITSKMDGITLFAGEKSGYSITESYFIRLLLDKHRSHMKL